MKILKSAIQKNVLLNKYYYSESFIEFLLETKQVCFFDELFGECYSRVKYVEKFREPVIRIFLEKGDELKVILDDDGMYTNVLIKQDGSKFFVIL